MRKASAERLTIQLPQSFPNKFSNFLHYVLRQSEILTKLKQQNHGGTTTSNPSITNWILQSTILIFAHILTM